MTKCLRHFIPCCAEHHRKRNKEYPFIVNVHFNDANLTLDIIECSRCGATWLRLDEWA